MDSELATGAPPQATSQMQDSSKCLWQGRFVFFRSAFNLQVGFYELVTTPDQPPNPWSFQCFDQSKQGAMCVILNPEDHARVAEYLSRLENPHLVCIAPLRGEDKAGFIEMFAGSSEAGQNIGLVLCDPKSTRDGPNLALCLVAYYEPQSRIVVAVIPPDQKNFLSDLKSRRIRHKQQRAQQQQHQQLAAHSTEQMLAQHSMTTDQHQQLPAHSTEQMLAHHSMTTDQHQQLAACSTEQMLAHHSMPTDQHQQLAVNLLAADHEVVLLDSRFSDYPFTTEQFEVIESQPQPPTLTIEEQPAQFYRFRYESEIEKDSSRVGGLLLGRSSTDGNKSFMKVRVGSIDPAQHSQLQLTVCTVNADDGAPHPYYLHGENCKDGFFCLQKSVDALDGRDAWEISFERLAVICVGKKKGDIEKGMEARCRNVPKLDDCPEAPGTEYTSSNMGRIRLSFSLVFTDTWGQSCRLDTVFSDEIISAKEKKNIEISDLNPAEVPIEGGCLVAIQTSTATTGIQAKEVKVHFTVNDEVAGGRTSFVIDVHEMKKHILLVKSPDVRHTTAKERLNGVVTIHSHSHGFQSNEFSIMFLRAACSSTRRSPMKRPRQN